MRITSLFVLAFAALAAAYAAIAPRLEYEGISAATTLADLKNRFADRVDRSAELDPANAKQPVSASVRFDPWLGRSHYMDYWERTGEQRVIRLFFVEPGTVHPNNDVPLRCNILLDELTARHGRAPKIEEFDEESLHHIKHVWTQANETMALDCARLPKKPLTVDRLFFECHGACKHQ
jgi:hypothetical protein